MSEMATTLLHEGIHAEIFKYVNDHQGDIDPEDRTNLLYYYFYYKSDNSNSLETIYAQHQYMADNYIIPIAKTIRLLDNNRYDLEFYLAFAWEGLIKYGYDGYYDNGEWKSLTKEENSQCYENKKQVNNTTDFGSDCISLN